MTLPQGRHVVVRTPENLAQVGLSWRPQQGYVA
ncbi:hypothetical protein QF030_000822 [Streptomyces rishiriensis]|uniref:Uncharacterized protein n=1 Tax=Streptomyces rishiriensis TaxID=68264 RepID=A0ABU0NHT5_STRRH|nr:hypothetical protein [Streptomyces rishiriensis]